MIDRDIPSVVVLGSVHMDLIATAQRLPGRGESVAGGSFAMSPGGKGGNQACQMALCDAHAFMLTLLGDDMFGRQLIAALKSKGVDTSLIAIDAREATGASTILAAEGDYSSIIASGAAGRLSEADVDNARAAIENADALVLQLELPVSISTYAARIAHAKRKCVVLNASPAPDRLDNLPKELIETVSVLIVNTVEAGRLLGRVFSSNESQMAASELAKRLNIETVVVTAGASGSAVYCKGETLYQPTYFSKVTDTVGAGDAYLGTFVIGYIEGLPIGKILRRAAAAGAITVSRAGAFSALPTRSEIDQFSKD